MSRNNNKLPKKLQLNKIMQKNVGVSDGNIRLLPSSWPFILIEMLLFIGLTLIVFALFDEYLYSSEFITLVYSMILSSVIIIGSGSAISLLMMGNKNKLHIVATIIVSAMLVGIMFLIGYIRFNTDNTLSGMDNAMGNGLISSNNTMNGIHESDSLLSSISKDIQDIDNACSGLLALAPACVGFLVAIIRVVDNTSWQRSLKRVRRYAAQLNEYINQQEEVIKQLEEALKIDQEKLSEEMFQVAVNELSASEEMVKMSIRERLAELMGDANAVDFVFENSSEAVDNISSSDEVASV